MTDPALPGTRPPGRARQWAADVAIALAVTAGQLGATHASARWSSGRHSAPGLDVYLLLAVAGLALVWRRRFPVQVLAVSLATTLAASRIGDGGMIWIALIAAFINAVIARKRAAAVASLAIGYLASTWPPWQIGERGHVSVGVAVGVAAWLLVLLAITELIRLRGQRAAALQRGREEQLRRRASEDRMRIARDLHDVLAHNISVINVQANTALHLMDRQPDRAKAALTAIHGVSKEALNELRAVLGVLRDGEHAEDIAPRAPGPGLARLPDLLSSVQTAGLDVQLTIEGAIRSLPADADIAAYRVIQESLTNVRRHSKAASAAVSVRYEASGVAIKVADEGAGPEGLGHSAGNGINGMAERVHELGGTFDAGFQAGGGFEVLAWLPVDEQAEATAHRAAS